MNAVLHVGVDEDLRLFAGLRVGDAGAMRALYRKHSPRLYALALRLVGNAADAEDVLQESFLRALRAAGSFRGEAAPGTWLCAIALNESREVLRRRARVPFEGREAREGDGGALPARDVPVAMRLEAALALLPDGYREVLVMHDVLGLEHPEIAQVLGVETGTSKSQLHKARARMREILGA